MNMIRQITEKLKTNKALAGVTIKAFNRPEALAGDKPSLVIDPLGPPKQTDYGSDKFLRKKLTYQVNVEASTYDEAKRIALAVEEELLGLGFYQLPEGLDEYFKETKRYVDARRYRGFSSLYDISY